MKGLLADVNVEGHLDVLVEIMKSEYWRSFWDHLQLGYFHFSDLGLAQDATDSLIWDVCQDQELILVTDNRNEDDPTSLEATIKARNVPTSLPVFTVANVFYLRQSRNYAERVVERMFDYLLRMDTLLGTGRLFVP